ncbi:GNAT family N-acetyltransferase [Aeromicrobium sp. NPDC092404]|uniref:GNAT family N-acetyltransferase n=1 Tax=Aeromicrobium sp. NPDC092404 TaxID=3154976 RepID=UPI00342C2473
MITLEDAPALLADGRPATLRPMIPTDWTAVEALFGATSEANLYTRFFTTGRGAVESHLRHLFDSVDGPSVLLLESDGRLMGIADVERIDSVTSEVAFLVADDAHGLGVATLLLEQVAEDARHTGVEWLVADVLAVNHPMLTVFADAGFTIAVETDRGEAVVRLSTVRTAEVEAASHARHVRAEQARQLNAVVAAG